MYDVNNHSYLSSTVAAAKTSSRMPSRACTPTTYCIYTDEINRLTGV